MRHDPDSRDALTSSRRASGSPTVSSTTSPSPTASAASANGHHPADVRRAGRPVVDRPEQRSATPTRRVLTPATCGATTGTTTWPATRVDVPEHVVLPPELTGVASPIIVVFGDRFPMITAHKVLAAYACLAPRIVTGQFDPTTQRAIWPSTGNYARGGIAISRIMASRGVAILPEGMSQERFDWLERWCENPAEDVIRTFGTESNVKEIYDACNELAKDPDQRRAQPVLRVRQPPRPLRGHRSGARPRVRHRRRRASRPAPRRLRVGDRIGGDDRRRRPARRTSTAPGSSPSRRWSARRCSPTGSASTTSRGSATSTSR